MDLDICYLQLDQLNVIIEDSRWQLLYLVAIQGPKKRYSMSLVKIILPLVCFRPEYSFFAPFPSPKNAFSVILNVMVQIDMYQHFKYGTISTGLNLKTSFSTFSKIDLDLVVM